MTIATLNKRKHTTHESIKKTLHQVLGPFYVSKSVVIPVSNFQSQFHFIGVFESIIIADLFYTLIVQIR